tara:strand:+ start:6840 stop:7967 length:1128 start_codon:yes stop_codon:yes gene_type:complete
VYLLKRLGVTKESLRALALRLIKKNKLQREITLLYYQFIDEYPFPSYDKLNNKIFKNFLDSNNQNIPLYKNFRNYIKPGWEVYFDSSKTLQKPPNKDLLKDRISLCKKQLNSVVDVLAKHSFQISNKTHILEIGTYDGAIAYELASRGAASVQGSDIESYYINETNQDITNKTIKNKKSDLNNLRNAYRECYEDEIANIVSFIDDDICQSSIPSNSKDLVVSWEVLEHIINPKAAFQEIFRILKPGGISFHEYNPFYSVNGGHSLCTLDFPWGHARLSAKDFDNYLKLLRPNERELALKFFHKNLNRLTIKTLQSYLQTIGFEIILLLPWVDKDHFKRIDINIVNDCKNLYPDVQITDLISPSIWLIIKKPEHQN